MISPLWCKDIYNIHNQCITDVTKSIKIVTYGRFWIQKTLNSYNFIETCNKKRIFIESLYKLLINGGKELLIVFWV